MFTFDSDTHGHLYTKSQVQDYVLRGECFEDLNFLNFMVETYEVTVRKGMGNEIDNEHMTSHIGRTKNPQAKYLSNHPKFESHIRIQRGNNHNYLPNFIGQWFPRRDRIDKEDYYYAVILALLRPWRNLQELKVGNKTWKDEGLTFLQTATRRQLNIVAGMQFFYNCKSKAQTRDDDASNDGNENDDFKKGDECEHENEQVI